MCKSDVKGKWVLILGASSGFGEAISRKFSSMGMNIVGVHLDKRSTLDHVNSLVSDLKQNGSEVLFFNMNAASKENMYKIIGNLKEKSIIIHCLIHSLAFGVLRPFIAESQTERINEEQMDVTLSVMANSLLYWTQALYDNGLLQSGSRIFAMTSIGGSRVWNQYGAVSAAKAALESNCRQLAFELAPYGITVNAILAGVTETPALKKIPGYEKMIEMAKEKNPSRRLTRPEDIANALSLLVQKESYWITGNVIGVDGGEHISG